MRRRCCKLPVVSGPAPLALIPRIEMNTLRLLAFALVAALCIQSTFAQNSKPYEPQVGQQGKDVIWVPTPDEIVERMLRMAQTTPNDYVIDLGAGDGKI